MRTLRISVLLCGALLARTAAAQDDTKPGDAAPADKPAAAAAAPEAPPPPPPPPAPPEPPPPPPQVVSPASGAGPAIPSNDWHFDFHGYFRAPLRFGLGHNDNPYPGQATTTIHTPVVPDDQYFGWASTSLQSRDWAEAFFSYGNNWVKGTLGILGFNFTDASWTQNGAQFGVGQGWLTLTPSVGFKNVRFEAKVGSFWSKYGMAGKYDSGKYDTYLFGRTHLMGETMRLELDVGRTTLWAEQGFGGKQPDPSIYNNAKFSLAAHVHGGISYNKQLNLGFHFLDSWTSAENTEHTQAAVAGLADGRLTVTGGELSVRNTLIGELYFGFSRIAATNVGTVDDAIEVLHAGGGGEFSLGVKSQYLDAPMSQPARSNGNGSVKTILFQYEFSLQNLLYKLQGKDYWGEGPNFVAAAFGMVNWIKSDDPATNDTHKLKYGGDFLVTPLKWLGIGTRIDRVEPSSSWPEESFRVISPRLVFKTAWITHEEVTLQYSRYTYTQRDCATPTNANSTPAATPACTQYPTSPFLPNGFGAGQPSNDANTRGAPTTRPDVNVFKLQATMWW